MNPLQVSKDSNLNKMIDAAVLLIIGMVVGIISAQIMAYYEAGSTTTTKVIQRVQVKSPDTSSSVQVPENTIWLQQI